MNIKFKSLIILIGFFTINNIYSTIFINNTGENITIKYLKKRQNIDQQQQKVLKSNETMEIKNITNILINKTKFNMYLTKVKNSGIVAKFQEIAFDSQQPKECKIKKGPFKGNVIAFQAAVTDFKNYYLECK